jgi:hypothetical protein
VTTVRECDGRCCAVFAVNALPHAEFTPPRLSSVQDGAAILAMLRPVGPDEAAQIASDEGLSPVPEGSPMYACRWWDRDTRRCVNYDRRPVMCAAYPYDYPCVHCGGRIAEAGS